MDTPIIAFAILICQCFYAISVALPLRAQIFSPLMKIGTYKKKLLKIDPHLSKISFMITRTICRFTLNGRTISANISHRL
jgi:hypothetical protein